MAGAALAGPANTVYAEGLKAVQSSCEDLGQLVACHWLERKPLPLIDESLSMEKAVCARDRFLSLIQPLMGAPLGYKAAGITAPAQRDLGIKEPLGGIYLAGMFSFENGAPIPLSYGNRPIVEAKLMVAVKDDAINEAKTVEEVAKHIAFIVPSIELGDSLVDVRQKLTAPILILYNVGARAALLGSPIAFDGSEKAIQALNSLVVTTTDASTGRQFDRQSTNAMMGGPLAAVLWIIREQYSRGVRLRAGDRLGLGALSRVRPAPGLRLETRWEGLTEAPTVDIAAVMNGLGIDRSHVVGLSMGAYAALQFGLRYPQRVSAIVAAAAGSGSSPSGRHAWLRETSILARAFAERGPAMIAEKIATSAARIQLKYKDPKRWQEFADQLRRQSGHGLSNTVIRCQALRPSLHDLRDQFATMNTPVLLIVGDEDAACLETNLMLKGTLPNAGLWISPNTGHTINLEEPAAFNAHLETFLGAVERQIWRRSYATAKTVSRRLSLEHKPENNAPIQINHERSDGNVIVLHQANGPADFPSELPP